MTGLLSAILSDKRGQMDYGVPTGPLAVIAVAGVVVNVYVDMDGIVPKPGTPTRLEYAAANPAVVVLAAAAVAAAMVGLAVYRRDST